MALVLLSLQVNKCLFIVIIIIIIIIINKSLCIEIQLMWNLKCTIIPIIIGATRIVTRSLRKNLEPVPGKYIHYKRQLYLEHHT